MNINSTFKSRKSPLVAIVIWATVILLLGLAIWDFFILEKPEVPWLVHLFDLAIAAFLLWFWFNTWYKIEDGFIKYKSGPLKGKIEIASIRELEINKSMWAGYKPALASKGVIVKYNKFDEIYFSPDNIEGFVEVLKKANPNIILIH